MKFECQDIERAFEVPELMFNAREHARNCPLCWRELWLWSEMRGAVCGLREEWESPELWPRIASGLAANPERRRRRINWKVFAAIAALLVAAMVPLAWPTRPAPAPGELLTERTLAEVQQTEKAYMQSIDKLARIAGPQLNKPDSPLTSACREKLLLLDQEIDELRAGVASNRFHAGLQFALASLYRQKKETLQEIVKNERQN